MKYVIILSSLNYIMMIYKILNIIIELWLIVIGVWKIVNNMVGKDLIGGWLCYMSGCLFWDKYVRKIVWVKENWLFVKSGGCFLGGC